MGSTRKRRGGPAGTDEGREIMPNAGQAAEARQRVLHYTDLFGNEPTTDADALLSRPVAA